MIGQKGIGEGKNFGGIEAHVKNIATRLALAGHEVFVYERSKEIEPKPSTYRGIHAVYLPTVYSKHLETIVHTFFATIHALFKPIDVFHYHGVGPSTLAWIPRIFKPRSRVVVTFHSQDRFHQKWGLVARAFLHFGEWSACKFPHATIAPSRTIQNVCKNDYGREAVYIPNGAEIKNISEADELEKFGLKKNEYLLSVSRLVRHKGQMHIIEAFKRIKTDKKLVIVGSSAFSGDYENELKKSAAGNSNIIFLGRQSGRVLDQLYAHAYLFVHASEYEGMPVVVLEAMGCGAPALVSDIPENLEAIGGSGFKFNNKDESDLVRELERLLQNPNAVHEMGERGQEFIASHYSWDKITKDTISAYDSVFNK